VTVAGSAARVYLDWNATTPPLPEVIEAMSAAAREAWGNPSSTHATGRLARACVEDARQAVATLASCDPRDVILTSGGTEANNLALQSAVGMEGGRIVTSRMEHPSVARVAERLERDGAATVRWVALRADGTMDLDDLERALSAGPVRLVTVQAVNPETGVVQALQDVLGLARKSGALVHVDAVQAFGRGVDTGAGADTRSLAAHKIRGPKSIGALLTRPGAALHPVLVGGSQERGLRPGTVDPVAAAGLAVAARHASVSSARWQALAPLRDRLEQGLLRAWPGSRINGATAPRAAHVTSIAFPGWQGAELVAALDLEGVAVSAGSACSAGTSEPSPVLIAMGDDEAARASVRFSLGEETRREDVELALRAAGRVLSRAPRRDASR
jgi:cysteine desulfurase